MVATAQRAVQTNSGDARVARAERSTAAAPAALTPHERLARAIEAQVVPRLLLSRVTTKAQADFALLAGVGPSEAEVLALATFLLIDDLVGAEAQIDLVLQRGVSHEQLLLDLLAPTARLLGQWWDEDVCDFGTVTLGLLRLRQMLRAHTPPSEAAAQLRDPRRRILVTSPPDEQHSFGRDMLAGFFRRAGWDVWDSPPQAIADMAALVRREWFAVIGISASSNDRIDQIASAIRAVRHASRNGEIGVMVGGPLFVAHPEYVALVGADATAADGKQATLQAERLLELLAQRD